VNLLMAMARIALLIRRAGPMIDDKTRVGTMMVSSLDLEAIQVCARELLRLQALVERLGKGDAA
jgi:hypothetical protein